MDYKIFPNGYFVNLVGIVVYDYNFILTISAASLLGCSPAIELLVFQTDLSIGRVDLQNI